MSFTKGHIVKVSGELPMPILREANTYHVLYPIPDVGVRPYMHTLRVAYPNMAQDQWIEPQILVKGLNIAIPIPGKPGDSQAGFVDFSLDEPTVGFIVGSQAWVNYLVSEGGASVSSQVLELTVQSLESKDLLAPEIFGANGQTLDLNKISGKVKCRIPSMPYLSTNKVLWVRVEGQDENLHPITHYPLQSHEVTPEEAEQGIDFEIDREWLSGCKDYTAITVIPECNYQGAIDHNSAVELRRETWQLRQLAFSEQREIEFESLGAEFIEEKQEIVSREIVLRFLSGVGKAGVASFGPVPGMRDGKSIVFCYLSSYINPPQHLRIELKQPVVRIRFAFTSLFRGANIVFFNPGGGVEASVDLPHGLPHEESTGNNYWVDVTATSSESISAFEVNVSDYSFIDKLMTWIK